MREHPAPNLRDDILGDETRPATAEAAPAAEAPAKS
jgi:hypothetical protein